MFAATALTLVTFALGVQAGINVSTPDNDGGLELCKTYTFDITGDAGPYYGFIVSGENPCDAALKEIGHIEGNKFVWTVDVNVPAGKTVMLAIENDHNVDGYSGKLSIKGSNTTCIASTSHPNTPAPNNAGSSPNAQQSATNGASRNTGSSLAALGLVSVAALALAL